MKISTNFDHREFLHPSLIKALGDQKSIQLIDRRVVLFAQALRDHLGKPITLNNWHSGGERMFSGVRPFDSSVGSFYSQHKYGRAGDHVVAGFTADELIELCRKEFNGKFKGLITTIELGTNGWLHADCRYTGLPTLLEVPYWKKPA